MSFENIEALCQQSENKKVSVAEIVLETEMETSQSSRTVIWEKMREHWLVMKRSIQTGLHTMEKSASGLVGGDAVLLAKHIAEGYSGETIGRTAAYAVGISECNAVMGKVVACPTAGSCGILPAALLAGAEKNGNTEDEIIHALFTAAGIGMVIEQNASISGAEGGCQAECGSAAGMAAAALVDLKQGSPEEIAAAVALALKNMLGLVCDPVAGLVEVPCVKRNGFAAVHAMVAADMALAGVRSAIPVDEVIHAMREIGALLPKSLKETSAAGLSVTPTAKKVEENLYGIK